jgi:heme exporter protein D
MDVWTAIGMIVVLIVVIISLFWSKRKIDKQIEKDE